MHPTSSTAFPWMPPTASASSSTDTAQTRIAHPFESIDIGGPFDQPAAPDPRSRIRALGCTESADEPCARSVLAAVAARAFRRPVQPKEVAPYLKLYTAVRKQGDTF